MIIQRNIEKTIQAQWLERLLATGLAAGHQPGIEPEPLTWQDKFLAPRRLLFNDLLVIEIFHRPRTIVRPSG